MRTGPPVRWYMEPVKQHLEKVDAKLDQNGQSVPGEVSSELKFIKDMSLFSDLTSDLVLNLLFHQYKDSPEQLATIQDWANKRYQERYEELMAKY